MSKCRTRRYITSNIVVNGTGHPIQVVCKKIVEIMFKNTKIYYHYVSTGTIGLKTNCI